MAKKPLLDATSRPQTAYSAFTKNYRQSANVDDQRGKQYQSTETGGLFDGTGSAWTTNSRSAEGAADSEDWQYGSSGSRTRTGVGTETPTSSTRKVDPEEAIRKTHTERK